MGKKNKILLIAIAGLCLLVAAVLIAYNSRVSQEAANANETDASASKTPLPQKLAGAHAGRSLKNAAVPPPGTEEADLKTGDYVFYPEKILDLLGIDKDWLAEERANFLNTVIHTDWMGRIDTLFDDMDPAKKDAIMQNHTALLAIKEALNEAYITGKIDWQTFKDGIAELLKWHQDTYASILSPGEYVTLFEFRPEDAGDIIDAMVAEAPQYSFILNQEIPIKEVIQQVPANKLEEINAHFNKMTLARDDIGKLMESGELTTEEAREVFNLSQQDFIAKCKEILTPEEINLIFGSVEGLESGSTDTESPAVAGTADIDELGFKIENPQTSVELVTEKIAKNKIEDLHFLYEKTIYEKDTLIGQLDAGEIMPEQMENLLREIDATYVEKCRKILTEEEFKLIFEDPSELKP